MVEGTVVTMVLRSTMTTGETEIENLLLTGLEGSTQHTSQVHLGRSRQGADRENDRTWGTCFY